MISISVPGFGDTLINNLVLDYNGTVAKDGVLLKGVENLIEQLSETIDIFVITADTFGTVASQMKDLPVKIVTFASLNERKEKLDLIQKLGANNTAAIGNGRNDEWMLKESRVGICLMGDEGCSLKALENADLVINDIKQALELFIFPNRLKATLRF